MHSLDKETKAQADYVICSRSYIQVMVSDFKPRRFISKGWLLTIPSHCLSVLDRKGQSVEH